MMTARLLCCVLPFASSVTQAAAAGGPPRKNMLFFIADDMRPQMNKAYGQKFMVTPNFDSFAETALVFDHAYTNFGICSASRNSFMVSRRLPATPTFSLQFGS
jgi:iduronate 2-sulfatase